MVSLPKGLERRVQTCSFATEEGIADSVSAANELSSCMQGFKCVHDFSSILSTFFSCFCDALSSL